MINKIKFIVAASILSLFAVSPAFAQAAEASHGESGLVAIGSAIAIGLAVIGGALGQGKLVSAISEAIGRNPSAAGSMTIPMFVGLALIESLVILAFIIALGLSGKV